MAYTLKPDEQVIREGKGRYYQDGIRWVNGSLVVTSERIIFNSNRINFEYPLGEIIFAHLGRIVGTIDVVLTSKKSLIFRINKYRDWVNILQDVIQTSPDWCGDHLIKFTLGDFFHPGRNQWDFGHIYLTTRRLIFSFKKYLEVFMLTDLSEVRQGPEYIKIIHVYFKSGERLRLRMNKSKDWIRDINAAIAEAESMEFTTGTVPSPGEMVVGDQALPDQVLPDQIKFCPSCGGALENFQCKDCGAKICVSCQAINTDPEVKFCTQCGNNLEKQSSMVGIVNDAVEKMASTGNSKSFSTYGSGRPASAPPTRAPAAAAAPREIIIVKRPGGIRDGGGWKFGSITLSNTSLLFEKKKKKDRIMLDDILDVVAGSGARVFKVVLKDGSEKEFNTEKRDKWIEKIKGHLPKDD
ncbi:MAG: zinc ribbon domain-containing protein [Promethearchaeota archaeon]